MYFFDLLEFCITTDIGSNSTSMFTSPSGDRCVDMASSFRQVRDAQLSAVNQWYDLSNPYSVTFEYDSGGSLSWPNTANFTLYTGGFTSVDDGYTITPITLTTPYSMNGVLSTNLYVSTNGFFTIGAPSTSPTVNAPSVGPPATICGNPGDNWLEPGLQNNDTTYQNLYYRTDYYGSGRHSVSILVIGGTYGNDSNQALRKIPTSWYATLYKDVKYQWLEVTLKSTSTVRGTAGPYNSSNVSVAPSTSTRVWRGDLNGQNGSYQGTGYVASPSPGFSPRICPECDTYYNQYVAMSNSSSAISNFWLDASNNFSNTTQANFTTYIQNVYHQQCLLKQLIKCVDGDTFTTFNNLTYPQPI